MEHLSSERIYCDDSVYCFMLSSNTAAWTMNWVILALQTWLFATYLQASNALEKDSDFKYTLRCTDSNTECENRSTVNVVGWILFCLVTLLHLTRDIFLSVRQIMTSLKPFDLRLLICGLEVLMLTLMAFFTSVVYNLALAEKNSDLLTNAVILLFINDLDEKCLDMLQVVAPGWTRNILEDINRKMNPPVSTSDGLSGELDENANTKARIIRGGSEQS